MMIRISTFILLGLCFLSVLSFAQQTHSTASSAPSSVAIVSPAEGVVSLDFQDADIKNVLKILAYKSGVNIVAGPEVTGTVTIQLNNVGWQKALDVLLSTYGYGYDRKGNIITVTTMENLKKRHENAALVAEQEPLTTQTYVLNFAKASEVVDALGKLKTSRGQINFDQRTNAVIVRDVQTNMDLIDEVLKTLDSPTPEVMIDARIIETDLTNNETFGIDWTINLQATGSSTPWNFPFYKNISGTFLNQALGGTTTTLGAQSTGSSTSTTGTQGITAFGNPASGGAFSYGTLSTSGLAAALKALSQRSNTRTLSNPKIVTLDNQTARIVLGEKYPLPQYTYNQEQAKLQVSGWNYLDIGIIFEVTPHVNNAGLVTLDLNPKVTQQGPTVTVETTQVPIILTNEAKTRVMIKDGDTLVIAGLISDQTTKNLNKVPFLGDIPLLGEVFKKRDNNRLKKELIFFLTPHIITAGSVLTSASTSSDGTVGIDPDRSVEASPVGTIAK